MATIQYQQQFGINALFVYVDGNPKYIIKPDHRNIGKLIVVEKENKPLKKYINVGADYFNTMAEAQEFINFREFSK